MAEGKKIIELPSARTREELFKVKIEAEQYAIPAPKEEQKGKQKK